MGVQRGRGRYQEEKEHPHEQQSEVEFEKQTTHPYTIAKLRKRTYDHALDRECALDLGRAVNFSCLRPTEGATA